MFIFDAPVGARVLSYGFMGATCLDDGEALWWDGKQWTTSVNGGATNKDIRSFKAFKRHVRQHGHCLKGRTITLVSQYIGQNITWKG